MLRTTIAALLNVMLLAACVGPEVDTFCREKGIAPQLAPIAAHGVRFTPNLCHWHTWGDALCRTAAYPVLSAPRLLSRGFEFVEYDIGAGHTASPRAGEPHRLVRLHLTDRPESTCLWVDEQINKDPNVAISGLERMGVARSKCLAADFDSASKSDYRFVLTTTRPQATYPTEILKVQLVNSLTGEVLAEVHNIQVGGGDHSSGFGCRNEKAIGQLLDVLIPVRPVNM